MFMYLWLPRETRTIWRNSLNLGIKSGLTRGKAMTILQGPLLKEPGIVSLLKNQNIKPEYSF